MNYPGTSTLTGAGGSGTGSFTYSKVSGDCTVSGSTVTATSGGTCTVTATKVADTNYNARTSSNLNITINYQTYTVTYDANSGSCSPNSREVDYGDTSAAPSCTRSGYTLTGFTRTSGSGGTLNTTTGAVTNVTGTQTIRADWAVAFSCGQSVAYQGHSYSTVQIGTQCWFAEDLRYTGTGCLTRAWNDSSPYNACLVNGGTGWDKDEVKYQHAAAIEAGCPTGWKIPTDAEWHTLENYLATGVCSASRSAWECDPAGAAMKTSTWGGNNSSGFTALPSALRLPSGSLSGVGSHGLWWSSSVDGASAWFRYLSSSGSTVYRSSYSLAYGFAVRCLRDL
jgi:uncharacterized protein (TIGR02145 family)